MGNFPQSFDDDTTLPVINDNLTELGGEAINALRDAVVNIEMNIGLGAAGTTPSIAARLGLLINPDGTPNVSTITSLGLVTLPIYDFQIATNAGIEESKLKLDYRTLDLFNYIRDLSRDVNLALGWVSVSGVKLEPHLIGAIYRHDLAQIDVAEDPSQFLNNVFRQQRDNSDSYDLINDMNNELLAHQWADGSPFGTLRNITTNDGSVYPSYYAHVASGIFLESSIFGVIPQTVQDVQALAEYIDQSSIFLYGTRIQNLYSNGISVTSRSSSLTTDGYGQPLVPVTPVIAYLATVGSPVDNITTGDDMIQFVPTDGYTFTAQFAQVRAGDIVRINYGTIEVAFVIKEKKYNYFNGNSIYAVRIAGKNLFDTDGYASAQARIDRPLFNTNKYGVLAVASANNVYAPTSATLQPSLIVGTPRGAQTLGNGFNPDQIDNQHYLLYLVLYPTGNPQDGYVNLPGIDVSGNAGSRPGTYTLSSVVEATNIAFRRPGFNYRFVAFDYQGNFGIMLADSYGDASFSIISAAVIQSGASAGQYDPTNTAINYPNNIVGILPPNLAGSFNVTSGSPIVPTTVSQVGEAQIGSVISFGSQIGVQYVVLSLTSAAITLTGNYNGNSNTSTSAALPTASVPPDPLGLGPFGANVASPPFQASYLSPYAAQNPTELFVPLKRNTYYVNGTERETLNIEVGQAIDEFGDGYWVGTVDGYNVIPGSRLQVTYKVPLDLSTSSLIAGTTIVVQNIGTPSLDVTNYGRFTIESITFECAPNVDTKITVYDGVHGTGSSPPGTLPTIGAPVALYFNSNSVTFNGESATDIEGIAPFKRYFETFIDSNGNTYSGERARFYTGGALTSIVSGGVTYNYTVLNPNSTMNRIWTLPAIYSPMSIVTVSPKLKGYLFGGITKITLQLTNYNSNSGAYTGYLARFDDTLLTYSNRGPITSGKQGQITRFYDETNTDYIDIIFDISATVNIPPGSNIDIQLFPTLGLDQEIMQLSSCQVTDNSSFPQISQLTDMRQFGNISEKQLSTSALSFLSAPDRLIFGSGVLSGFSFETTSPNPNPNDGQFYLTGGVALVNGVIINMNPQSIVIPMVQEFYASLFYNINWLLCVNDQGEYEPLPLLDYDSTLPTPNNPNRLVQVYNVINGQTYNVVATTFSDVVNTRKDLTPLWIIASTVTSGSSPTISLSVTDARRYSNDSDTNFPLKLTSANAQGNFKSPVAILNWIKYNNAFNGTAIVKGATPNSGTIDTILDLDFTSTVSIDGQDDATLTFNKLVTLGSNLVFQNLDLIFNGGISIATGVENLTLDNCNITINLQNQTIATPFVSQFVFDILNGNNITITNCSFTITSGSNTTSGAVFRLTNTTNFTYDNNPSMEIYYWGSSIAAPVGNGTSVPGDVFVIRNSPGVTITNSSFGNLGTVGLWGTSTNFNQFLRNTGSNDLTLQNLVVESTYTPLNSFTFLADSYNSTTDLPSITDGLPVVNYNPLFPNVPGGDMVNSGRGWIYSNVSTALDGIIIDNVQFINNQPAPTIGYHRFSYINFELSSISSILSNVRVTNNRFVSLNTGGSIEDARPAVAIINTSAAATSVNQQPALKAVFINSNYCNRSQHVILTSRTNGGGQMVYPGLYAQNVTVQDNTCGSIGYWVSAGSKVINFPPNANQFSDKTSGLLISDNVCHDITNCDSTGLYFLVSRVVSGVSTNMCQYPSGYVAIRDNSCNWIHTGISYEESSSLDIIDNSLTAYDINYLIFVHADGYEGDSGYPNAIYDTRLIGPGVPGVSTGYAIVVSSNKKTVPDTQAPGEGNDSPVRIAGNVTGTGYWLETTTFTFIYNYFYGYIMTQSSANIESNNLRGVGNDGYGYLVLAGGLNNQISNNSIYRKTGVIFAYIGFGCFDSISPGSVSWNGLESTGVVQGNYFDSPYTDNVTTNVSNNLFTEAVVKFNYINVAAYQWTVNNNKNQTGYLTVGMTSQLVPYGYAGYAQGGISALGDGYYNTQFYIRQALTTSITPVPAGVTLNSNVYRSLILHLHDEDVIIPRVLGWQETIDKFMPAGSRLMLIQMGVKPFETIVTTTASGGPVDSRILMTLNKYGLSVNYINLDYLGTVPDAIYDSNVINEYLPPLATSALTAAVTGGQINSTSNTYIMSVDTTTAGPGGTDISNFFIAGNGDTAFGASVDIVYQRVSGITTDLGFSPLFIKYRW
jgi:hypothetical protein